MDRIASTGMRPAGTDASAITATAVDATAGAAITTAAT